MIKAGRNGKVLYNIEFKNADIMRKFHVKTGRLAYMRVYSIVKPSLAISHIIKIVSEKIIIIVSTQMKSSQMIRWRGGEMRFQPFCVGLY